MGRKYVPPLHSLEKAKKLGSGLYYEGWGPCENGHVAHRRVETGECAQCWGDKQPVVYFRPDKRRRRT